MNITEILAEELGVKQNQTEEAVKLIDEGNTIPFIARYRKEATGGLDDEQLRILYERLTYLRNLDDKRKQVLKTIEDQGKLTAELRKQIEAAETQTQLEDLYRPYRPKRKTRASVAREKGLQPLADLLRDAGSEDAPEKLAEAFVSEENGVADVKAALAGACDIMAEEISENADVRGWIRDISMKEGVLVSTAKNPEEKTVYETYYEFQEKVSDIPGYRILAVNRGEKEKILGVSVKAPEEEILSHLRKNIIPEGKPVTAQLLADVCADSYKRLIAPATEREIRAALTERAEGGAITVFRDNLRQLLMSPPIKGHVVLGWDPGFRTGCKIAVVDETGKVLETTVIYPTAPTTPAKIQKAKETIIGLIRKHNVTLISLGNGTASRESEQIICEILAEIPEKVSYVIVNEAGASVYSASALATKEFPNLDVGGRSSASMARRLQDPMAELVKIDPRSIGVGQYQHDMNQKNLSEALGGVVEDCVNSVGVDLNTASASLLEHISGISSTVAANIVAYREDNGAFTNRKQLLKVAKLGPKAFQQAAGFLRITGGDQVLDSTAVHPESYEAATELLKELEISPEQISQGGAAGLHTQIKDVKEWSEKLNVGELTLKDIISELEKPGRDPREELPKPLLRSDVLEMSDLKPGMRLTGTVRNVIDFGAFVDIGVHQDGLVHISQLSDEKFVKNPLDVVHVGDIVEVTVLGVDEERGRISLTMRKDPEGLRPLGGQKKDADKKNDQPKKNGNRQKNENRNNRKGSGDQNRNGRGKQNNKARQDQPVTQDSIAWLQNMMNGGSRKGRK